MKKGSLSNPYKHDKYNILQKKISLSNKKTEAPDPLEGA